MTKVAAAYLVRGDDALLADQEARGLVEGLVGEEDPALVLEEHSGEDLDLGAVVAACSTPPFLSQRRVVLVRDANKLRAPEVAGLVAYLDDPLPSTALVLVAGGGSVPVKLANAVKKAGKLIDTTVGRRRPQWLASRLKAGPVHLDGPGASLLGEHLGEELWRVDSVLDTLAMAYGEGARLGVEQLEPFLGHAGGVAPWDLTDAIDKGDTEGALEVLHRMMEGGGRHPLVLMSTLHRHYANMLRLDGADVAGEDEAAALLGSRSSFTARKALVEARRLGTAGLARAITLLADADLDLRGITALPPEIVMEVLVARLSRLTRPQRASRSPRAR
ncbi:MAG: DNA polymerase III subunit delta [Acidimicrobiales bacterium]